MTTRKARKPATHRRAPVGLKHPSGRRRAPAKSKTKTRTGSHTFVGTAKVPTRGHFIY